MSDGRGRDGLPAGAAGPTDAALPGAGSPRAAWRLLRPHQWSKNLVVFAALIFAQELFDARAFALALLAFASFCVTSSSVYVVNDLLDAKRDRLHPEKRFRPIASGAVSPAGATALAAVLSVLGLGSAFWIEPRFGAVVVGYVALSHFYSLVGKNFAILDVMLIAAGFVLRAVGGAYAIRVPISDWFVLCTLFLALFLALSKRKAELEALGEGSGRHRPVLAQYTGSALTIFTSASMALVLMTYALYVREQRDAFPWLPLTMPFVLFAVFRYHLLVETACMGEKPEEVFLRDRPFQVCVLGFGVAAVAALYVGA